MEAKLETVQTKSLKLPKPKYIVNSNGKKISVLLDIRTYNRLIEETEDFIDNRLIDEVKNEPTIPLEQALTEEDKRRGYTSQVAGLKSQVSDL